jgi:multiple sugar transport system ATP-binding protein
MAAITLEHVSKRYPNGVLAVDDLSLTINDGELLVLVGPSGCGKSTTLRLVAGLESATSGSLAIGGQRVNDLPPRFRDVALVFQRPTIFPHLSVRDNLAFGERLRHDGLWRRMLRLFRKQPETGSALDSRIDDAARTLGLSDVLERRPFELSGGQQQRVALGRALVRNPAAFLLDEPLSNLDARLRSDLRRDLHLLQRRLRATMLYVTHDQVEAMTLGDRVAVLDGGRLQQIETPLALYDRPVNRFVAGFLGWPAMNFLDGLLRRVATGLALDAEGTVLPLPETANELSGQYNEKEVSAGFRPEHVKIRGNSANWALQPADVPFTMRVLLVEPVGSTCLVTLERNGRRLLAQIEGRPKLCEGEAVEVAMDMRHIHLFDLATGTALFHGAPAG